MQKPTEDDYKVSLAETYNINASADMDGLSVEEDDHNGFGPEFVFELENNPSFYAECNDSSVAKAWLHNAKAVLSVLARLHEAEELLLKLLAAREKINIKFDPITGLTQDEAATIADGMDDYESAEKMLLELAERIKAGREAQNG